MFSINIRTAALSVLAACFAAACSGKDQQTKQISQQGINDAMRLVEIAPSLSPTAIEKELLEIRAREYEYRTQIGDTQADAYIKAFESGIKQADDSLARLIFEPEQSNTEEYAY